MLKEERKLSHLKCSVKSEKAEKRKLKNTKNKFKEQTTFKNVIGINLAILIMTKYECSKYTNEKTEIVRVNFEKENPNLCCLQKFILNKRTDKLKLKGQER